MVAKASSPKDTAATFSSTMVVAGVVSRRRSSFQAVLIQTTASVDLGWARSQTQTTFHMVESSVSIPRERSSRII